MLIKSNSFVSLLIDIAKKSNMTNKHSVAVLSGKRILTAVPNCRSDLPNKNLFKIKKRQLKNFSFSIHAEKCALDGIRLMKFGRSKLRLFVIRINTEDKLIQSKPCNNCIDLMKLSRVKKVTL